jgi:hypothetical protein
MKANNGLVFELAMTSDNGLFQKIDRMLKKL